MSTPFATTRIILQELGEKEPKSQSSRTVRRRLRERGLKNLRSLKKPILSKKNIKALLKFAYDHVSWPENQWKNAIFSDKSKFNLFGLDRKG